MKQLMLLIALSAISITTFAQGGAEVKKTGIEKGQAKEDSTLAVIKAKPDFKQDPNKVYTITLHLPDAAVKAISAEAGEWEALRNSKDVSAAYLTYMERLASAIRQEIAKQKLQQDQLDYLNYIAASAKSAKKKK